MADEEYQPAKAPPSGAGQRLKAAREAAGLTLAQISTQTKIPARMLTLIEAGDFGALPSRTYATGFTRNYARALGLDEADYVAAVRHEIGTSNPVELDLAPTFEPGDPARIPSAKFAWLAVIGALAVIAAGLALWRTYYTPAVTLPPILPEETASPALPEVMPTLAPDTFLPATEAALTPSAGIVQAAVVPTTPPAVRRSSTGSGRISAPTAEPTAAVPAMPQFEPSPVPVAAPPAPTSAGPASTTQD